ncbi:hypothetical protein [Sphingobacterium sp. CZ-UAM]|uniref:hypothetical protein n=1 Tax=Sphingobacterium sp. CZ-UAM TaxID=1933868 RepID=UPI00111567EA|nr:hypothetical protein [Sphingobacterium sp. CZ-UAM]
MHIRYHILLFSSLIWFSCTKDPIVKKTEPPVPAPADTSKKEPDTPKDKYELHKIQFQVNELFADDAIDEQVFLGSIWDLKDTVGGPQLESMASQAKKVNFHILSYNDLSVDMGFFEPSYSNILAYANKFNKSKQASSINYAMSTFEDYAEVQGYLGNSGDVKAMLSLVKHADSTTIQKPNSMLLVNNVNKLNLFIDHTEYLDAYPETEVANLINAGYSPYVLASVTYGSRMILMGESDSTGISLRNTINKVLDNNLLDDQDIKVLDCSKLLIYCRGGGKESFIQYPAGAKAIETGLKDLRRYMDQTENIFDYPLTYSFMSLVDYSTLSYYNQYSVRKKKQE